MANGSSQSKYILPESISEKERERLNLQHRAFVLTLSGLYPAEVDPLLDEVLKPSNLPPPPKEGSNDDGDTDASSPKILDIGTGTGIWAIDMAVKFPHASVVGVDINPPTYHDPSQLPPNCRFETGNFLDGFPQFENAFDVVHSRCIGAGTPDLPSVVRNLLRCLRPGGVFLICESNTKWVWAGKGRNKWPMGAAMDSDPDNIFVETSSPSPSPTANGIKPNGYDSDGPGQDSPPDSPAPSGTSSGGHESAPSVSDGAATKGDVLDRSWYARCYAEANRLAPFAPPPTDDMTSFLYGCQLSDNPSIQLSQVGTRRLFTPIGWIERGRDEDEASYGPEVGALTLLNVSGWIKFMVQLLSKWSTEPEAMQELERKMVLEFASEERRQTYLGWDYGWAVRT